MKVSVSSGRSTWSCSGKHAPMVLLGIQIKMAPLTHEWKNEAFNQLKHIRRKKNWKKISKE